jgi:hypothetical protein
MLGSSGAAGARAAARAAHLDSFAERESVGVGLRVACGAATG